MRIRIFAIFLLGFLGLMSFAQENASLYGRVIDQDMRPIELVNVAVIGYSSGSTTNARGEYELSVPPNKDVFIRFTFIGYEDKQFKVNLNPGERREHDVALAFTSTDLGEFEIKDEQIRSTNYIRLDPKEVNFIPTISGGGIEDMIMTMPGVTTTNELSSQYSVRGGNFDENLVYVDGIEIYRPFLIRAGQQEGLSFLNSKLVSSILFSAGGFDAKYGDKMSSVLDIKYKKPVEFGGSVELSFLGAQAHVEGRVKDKFTYLFGARYKTNQYILKGLDVSGNYKPNFIDMQGKFTYDLNKKFELSLMGYYSRNSYKMIPETRETDFGTFSEAYRLKVYFDGQEVDQFTTYMGAITLNYKQNQSLKHTFTLSSFRILESETYTIQGQYWLGLLENAPGDDQFGDVVATQGVGTHLDHARNKLDMGVYNAAYRGILEKSRTYLLWGVKYQHERITDRLHEWEMIDSAGYSIPYPPVNIGGSNTPPADLELFYAVKANSNINSNRITGFVQHTWDFRNDKRNLSLTAGIRGNYWDYNNEFVFSPRVNLSYDPKWKRDVVFRFAAGYYYQPPFYRELRNFQGELNPNIKSQKSIHFVAGSDIMFQAWDRPFKFVAEVYYKYLDNLIPYVVDNVRIRYYGENVSHGYATGLDMKVNGEFIKGIESWMSMSIMKTMEDIEGDYYYDYYNEEGILIVPGMVDNVAVDSNRVEPGYISRPTDQRFNFSIFFQDYLPKNPSWRAYLKLIFGTGLPFGPPDEPKYKHTLRYPSYRRVDLGLTKQLIGGYSTFNAKNPLRHINNAYISLEIFNLFQVYNTISYTWVSDFNGRKYAVPNYLTPRQVNLRLIVEF